METLANLSLIKEIHSSLSPISSLIEPLHAYLFALSTSKRKEERLKPTAFFFALSPTWEKEKALDSVLELYRYVTNLELLLHEAESSLSTFEPYAGLISLLKTSFALKKNIVDISSQITGIKCRETDVASRVLCKKIFYYTESVRALVEELSPLKTILIEDLIDHKGLFLMGEPLDLERDLE